ncbi:MAG: response regulator [Desulfobacterales bacterium]|nr:response regulator [Desulfobacterales bacterium]
MTMLEKPKILIVDDNPLNIKLCSAILMKKYDVFKAASAEEGIESARRILPELILMDIQLPGMDGLTATGVIKNDDHLRSIPVIALTSFAMVGDREKALEAGCDEYLPKPLDISKLQALIAHFLEPSGCGQAAAKPAVAGASHHSRPRTAQGEGQE